MKNVNKSVIAHDYYRLNGDWPSFGGFVRALWLPGFRYLFFLRLIQRTRWRVLKLFLKIFLRHYQFKFGYQIPPLASIGPGLTLGHFGNIIINGRTKIGENCNISAGALIGASSRGAVGAPEIGSFVWIGVNAIIVGKVKIGNNVLIAPGAYVNQDVPSDSIVIGNPGVIKANTLATKGYINRVPNNPYPYQDF